MLPIVVDRLRDAVDVGAYVGSYTFALAGLAHMVYAFEPDAELAGLLRSAAPANVRVAHSAVSRAPNDIEPGAAVVVAG